MVLQLVKIYDEDCKDIEKARNLLDRICNQWVYEFKNVDDLAECFAAWVELELKVEAWDNALDIARSSVIVAPNAPTARAVKAASAPAQAPKRSATMAKMITATAMSTRVRLIRSMQISMAMK